jgi:hypothetical protein
LLLKSPLLRGGRGLSPKRFVRVVAALGIAFAFAAGGVQAALASRSDEPPPGSTTVATSTPTSSPASTAESTAAAPTPTPDPAPLPSPEPATPPTVTKPGSTTASPRRATATSVKPTSVNAEAKPTATHPVVQQTTFQPVAARPVPKASRPLQTKRPVSVIRRVHRTHKHKPSTATSSSTRVLRPAGRVAPKKVRNPARDLRPLHRDPKSQGQASRLALPLEPASSGDGWGFPIEFALIGLGALLLLAAATPAWAVPPHLARSLEFRRLDIALVGFAILVVDLVLLAIV